MKRSYKIILAMDVFLALIIALLMYTGCYLGRTSKSAHLVQERHRLVFKAYNDVDMLFAPDNFTDDYSMHHSLANVPNINVTVVDIPSNANDVHDILNLHYSVSLGFLPGADAGAVNRALYNGHKTFYKLTVKQDGSDKNLAIDLSKTEQENIRTINRILVRGDYDGIYMAFEDAKLLEAYPALARKVRDSLSFVTVADTVCYKSRACYITDDITLDHLRAVFARVYSLSSDGGQWTVIISYAPGISPLVRDVTTMTEARADELTRNINRD